MSEAGGPGASAGTKDAWTETRLWSLVMTKPRNLDSFHQQGKALRNHSSTFSGSYSLLFVYLSISLLFTPCWKFVTRRNMENGCLRRKKWIWSHMKRGGWKKKHKRLETNGWARGTHCVSIACNHRKNRHRDETLGLGDPLTLGHKQERKKQKGSYLVFLFGRGGETTVPGKRTRKTPPASTAPFLLP